MEEKMKACTTSAIAATSPEDRRALMEQRLRNIDPGSWFTWGTQAVWCKVRRVEGDQITAASGGVHSKERILRSFAAPGLLVATPGQILPEMPAEVKHEVRDWLDQTLVPGVRIRRGHGFTPWEVVSRDGEKVFLRRSSGNPRETHTSAHLDALSRIGSIYIEQEESKDMSDEKTAGYSVQHKQDIAVIFKALEAEARERNWCYEYQQFLERVNENLFVPLAPQVKPYETKVNFTFSLMVDETNEEQAGARVRTAVDKIEMLIRDISGRVEGVESLAQIDVSMSDAEEV